MYTIYSKQDCVWCDSAKKAIINRGEEFNELVLGKDFTKEELLVKMQLDSNVKITLPQIWADDLHIGGYNNLLYHYGEDILS